MLDAISQGLSSLTPQEMAELDSFITPRFAQLMTKALPDIGPLLAPFLQDEQGAPMPAAGQGFGQPPQGASQGLANQRFGG